MRASDMVLESLNIERPTLVVDRDRANRNIERMVARAAKAGVAFRPHFKTHQSLDVANWFRDVGVATITVSSLEMARYFADDGWTDVTVASPVNLREMPALAELADHVQLGVLADSRDAVEALGRLNERMRVWVKINVGYGRAGVAWDDEQLLSTVAGAVVRSPSLELAGVLTHNGLVYRERTSKGVVRAHSLAMERLAAVREHLSPVVGGDLRVSIGDTPSASLVDEFEGADEIRPGNFVFYDLTQVAMGACAPDDVAVALACPAIGTYPRTGRVLLYGGAVHLSMDSMVDERGRRSFGSACLDWPRAATLDAPVTSISQEHGVLELTGAGHRPELGELVCVLPVHSCLTCNLHPEYVTLDGHVLKTIHSARGC